MVFLWCQIARATITVNCSLKSRSCTGNSYVRINLYKSQCIRLNFIKVENTIEIEVEIVETIVQTEVEEEIDPIQEKEEETNLDLDQVKDTLTKVRFVVSAIEADT